MTRSPAGADATIVRTTVQPRSCWTETGPATSATTCSPRPPTASGSAAAPPSGSTKSLPRSLTATPHPGGPCGQLDPDVAVGA